jgi:trehalose 2-sulfotransferase
MTETANSSYFICTTPRSGSTLLCELLEGTGVAGRPDEYFQQLRTTGMPMTARDYLDGVAADLLPDLDGRELPLEQHSLYDPRRFTTFAGYVAWAKHRATTDNGVLGMKIMWPYMAGLVDGLSVAVPGAERSSPHDVLSHAFPRLRYVWLRRMDKVRQAVSLWRAIQTWHWREDAARGNGAAGAKAPAVPLRYSFEAIDHLRRRLIASDRAWEIYFETSKADPLTLTYEDFVPDMHETVIDLLRHVGVRVRAEPHCCMPRTARQSDGISERWVTRFRADFDARVPAVG